MAAAGVREKALGSRLCRLLLQSSWLRRGSGAFLFRQSSISGLWPWPTSAMANRAPSLPAHACVPGWSRGTCIFFAQVPISALFPETSKESRIVIIPARAAVEAGRGACIFLHKFPFPPCSPRPGLQPPGLKPLEPPDYPDSPQRPCQAVSSPTQILGLQGLGLWLGIELHGKVAFLFAKNSDRGRLLPAPRAGPSPKQGLALGLRAGISLARSLFYLLRVKRVQLLRGTDCRHSDI